MGDLNVKIANNAVGSQKFVRHLLNDVQAMEHMLANDWFEDDIIRIGAEQEMCIIDKSFKPAHFNIQLLDKIQSDDVVTELAKFNIELNLDPQEFTGSCFSILEQEIQSKMDLVWKHCEDMEMMPILTGILPTIRKSDVALENVTPLERYRLLMEVLNKLRGDLVELKINGTDELNVKHDSALLEACNTSFQVHLQIRPQDFVQKYNHSQAIAGPVMALAVNSPLLFGKRLWHETRIALFQQSVDTRRSMDHLRDRSPRVMFGNSWLTDSITELYKEDIVRYRVILNSDIKENVHEMIEKGITPKLRALNIHNGTVYRWNRPCYGISPNGKPHLRIENRIFPAGPSILDEVANASFWIGLMNGMENAYGDITTKMDFDDAKNNFFVASQHGLNSYMNWLDGHRISAAELLSKELLPIAREGLKQANITDADISRYMDVIEARIDKQITGSSWMLKSYNKLIKDAAKEEAATAITSSIVQNQRENIPVHKWPKAKLEDIPNWSPHVLKVEEFMTTDIFSVQPNDILELVADILDWRKIRYLPVEDKKGKLVGLITSRMLLRYFKQQSNLPSKKPEPVKSLMLKDPTTISPYDTIMDALRLMEENKIGCLPVVKNGKLVGVVTEMDFMRLSSRLMKRLGNQQAERS
ncbi:MAG: CBS domain-containing protein [Saprospiraceae bacterium]|nr:CBS domain-containing protein [Saprospiraceae bacterium]